MNKCSLQANGQACPRPSILVENVEISKGTFQEKVLQHDVVVTIEEIDKAGNFIGWLWVDNENLSISLVEHGFASVHHTAESSEYARQIKAAEESALNKRLNIWKEYVEVDKQAEKERNAASQERVLRYEPVLITEITAEGHLYAQNVDQGPRLLFYLFYFPLPTDV